MTINKLRIAMVGPFPPPIGGASVLFKLFADGYSNNRHLEITIIETWKPGTTPIKKFFQIARCFLQLLFKSKKVDLITFWASQSGALAFGPLVNLVSLISQKPWILRRFGQSYATDFHRQKSFQKKLLRYVYNQANLVLLETKYAVSFFKQEFPEANLNWHANYRKITDVVPTQHDLCKSFVYLGRVKEEKGINEIISAAGKFNENEISVDIYGPLEGKITKSNLRGLLNIRYCGMIEPELVSDTLRDYGALLLPTYYENEGYPGVVLEAYSVGIPVITTDWLAIPEIVDQSCGLLVQPRNIEDLYEAMRKMVSSPDLYQELAYGALIKREEFSLESGQKIFLDYCVSVIAGSSR